MTKLSDVILRGTHAGRPAFGTAGRLYYETDTTTLFRDSGSAWENVEGTGSGGSGAGADGWVDDTAQTWTYASATTFTVATDLTAQFKVGTRLKLTQTTVKYFVVVASSYSAPNTTVTITGGTDYTFANAAVTLNYHSYMVNPQGYPGSFTYAPTLVGWSATPTTQFARFSVVGNICTLFVGANGTSNSATTTATAPIAKNSGAGGNAPFCPVTVKDSGTYATGRCYFSSTTVITFGPSATSDAWTASGTKDIYATPIAYEI